MQLVGGDDLIHDARRFGLFRIAQLTLQQEGRGGHGTHFAHQPGGAAHAGKDADHDLGQSDFGLWIVGGKNAVACQRDFQPNAKRCAGQAAGNRLAAFVGLGVLACALNFAQDTVAGHQPVHKAPCGVVARGFLHGGNDVQVHAARKRAGLARGDDHALNRVIG